MNEELPRRVQHWEAVEKLGEEDGMKFYALQSDIRMKFKTSTPIHPEEESRFWSTYNHFFHNQ
jgi:hypothetical protein